MRDTSDPIARAAWPKNLAEDSLGDTRDPRDVLGTWERQNFFGRKAVQLRIPLRDPVEALNHLGLIEEAFHTLIASSLLQNPRAFPM